MPVHPTPERPASSPASAAPPAATAQTVPVRRFWPLLPVAAAMAVVFALWWPGAPAVLHALVGTAALVVTATVVVLLDGRRSDR